MFKAVLGPVLFLILTKPFSALSQPDIPLEPDLQSNVDSWHVKIRQNGIWGNKPAQISFGPLRTYSTNAEKSKTLSKDVNRELNWKNIYSESGHESSMEVLLEPSDTAEIRMLTIKSETIRKRSVVGSFANADPGDNEIYMDSTWIDEMTIRFQQDSTEWRFFKLDSGNVYARLECEGEGEKVYLFRVNNLKGKKQKEILFSQPATGFFFQYGGKQVAAFQTLLKQTVWITKNLEPKIKRAILITTAALMATIKAGNANGF